MVRHESAQPRTVSAAPVCELGESPRWDAAGGRLWWVDLLAGWVHRLDPALGTVETTDVGQPVSALAAHRHGWVVAVETAVQYRDPGFALLHEVPVLSRPTLVRMNDAALDPAGRFLVGTLAYDGRRGAGALYRIDDRGVAVLLDGLDISNGIAWTSDGRTLYHVDSGPGTIHAYGYDPATGTLGQGRIFYRHPAADGVPDGIALDALGGLWVAIWGGGKVIRLDPAHGQITDTIVVDAVQPAGVCFGGPLLDTLYITSARVGLDRPAHGDGALYAAGTAVPGQAHMLVPATPPTSLAGVC
jgi:sugar lactone lactonase YvrE